jgi:hypothetical protein
MVLFSRGEIVESIQGLKNFDDAKSDRLLGWRSWGDAWTGSTGICHQLVDIAAAAARKLGLA